MLRAKIMCGIVFCLLASAAARAGFPMIPATTVASTAPAVTPETAAMAEAMWPNPDDQATTKAREALERHIADLASDQQPFERVINYLRESTNTNIFVNWTAIAGAGVDKNTPVTVNLQDVPYRKALLTVLSEVGGGQSNLGYCVDDGVITISTRDELITPKYQVVRTYRISDLIPADGVDKAQRDTAVKELMSKITGTVAPDTWRDAGGTIGAIREFNGSLLINQTPDSQEVIRKLLISLAADQLPATKAYAVDDIINNGSNQPKEERFKALEALIVSHNSPAAWGPGGKCSVTEFDGKLYVTAPEPMHLRIKALLDLVKSNEPVK